MTSWSYQSTNPCTVLVKEKQDGLSPSMRDCPPPILQSSSTETVASSQDQTDISSLGNIVGGKETRSKRQAHDDVGVVDVVFDNGDGHEFEMPIKTVTKRFLVNISIAMDTGLGTKHMEVYQLQVAVPLPEEELKSEKFYAYNVDENVDSMTLVDSPEKLSEVNKTFLEFEELIDFSPNPDFYTTTDPNDDSSSSNYDDGFITSSAYPEGLEN